MHHSGFLLQIIVNEWGKAEVNLYTIFAQEVREGTGRDKHEFKWEW
jgi:hypothetical protein